MTDYQTDRTSHSTIKPRTDKLTSAGMIISSAQTDMTKWPLTCCTVDLNHKRESWGRGDRGGNDRTRAQLQCSLAWDKRYADSSRFTASLELSRSSQKMHTPGDRVVADAAAATITIMPGSFRASKWKPRRQKCDKDLDWTGPDLGLAPLIQFVNPGRNTISQIFSEYLHRKPMHIVVDTIHGQYLQFNPHCIPPLPLACDETCRKLVIAMPCLALVSSNLPSVFPLSLHSYLVTVA